MNSTPDDDQGSEQLLYYDVERIVDRDVSEIDKDCPIFCSSTEEVLAVNALSALLREMPFIKARTIIRVHYAE